MRDYLDVAALADAVGPGPAARVLVAVDDFYADLLHDESPVATQVAVQLADPRPRDAAVITELPRYKGLERRWWNWDDVRSTCAEVAGAMVTGP